MGKVPIKALHQTAAAVLEPAAPATDRQDLPTETDRNARFLDIATEILELRPPEDAFGLHSMSAVEERCKWLEEQNLRLRDIALECMKRLNDQARRSGG